MSEEYKVQIVQDPETGIVEHESWRLDDKLHRFGAPALILRDPETGNVFHEAWYQHGLMHRVDEPAEIFRNRKTGRVVSVRYFEFGKSTEPKPDHRVSPEP